MLFPLRGADALCDSWEGGKKAAVSDLIILLLVVYLVVSKLSR